jgi:hypothetical protein
LLAASPPFLTAKCYVEDEAAVAYKSARETATDIGKKASHVVDKGIEAGELRSRGGVRMPAWSPRRVA